VTLPPAVRTIARAGAQVRSQNETKEP
jgi:hypothetical protein